MLTNTAPGTALAYIFEMRNHPDQTIIAPITANAPAAVAGIRLSGPEAISLVAARFRGKKSLSTARSHSLIYGRIVSDLELEPETGSPDRDRSQDGDISRRLDAEKREAPDRDFRPGLQTGSPASPSRVIDDVLVAVFRAPHSYTGEEVVEIYSHGSPLIVRRIIELLLASGARLADPGEFTRRAFLNGRIDLAQAEAVADMISAADDQALALARRQFEGQLSREIASLREPLIRLAAHAALGLDFGEEDLGLEIETQVKDELLACLARIEALIASHGQASLIKEGFNLVIAGPPNAGKSSLFNRLLSQERAIVSPIPGTTRDALSGEILLGGRRFILHDTAGIRASTADPIEALGIERSRALLAEADLILWCDERPAGPARETAFVEFHQSLTRAIPILRLGTKSDLAAGLEDGTLQQKEVLINKTDDEIVNDWLGFSLVSGEGFNELLAWLESSADRLTAHEGAGVLVGSLRQQAALARARDELGAGLEALEAGALELAASDIRRALEALGEITGEITNEDILDSVFSKFCLGK